MKNREILTMDEAKVIEEAQKAAEEVCDAATEDYMNADSQLARMARRGLL